MFRSASLYCVLLIMFAAPAANAGIFFDDAPMISHAPASVIESQHVHQPRWRLGSRLFGRHHRPLFAADGNCMSDDPCGQNPCQCHQECENICCGTCEYACECMATPADPTFTSSYGGGYGGGGGFGFSGGFLPLGFAAIGIAALTNDDSDPPGTGGPPPTNPPSPDPPGGGPPNPPGPPPPDPPPPEPPEPPFPPPPPPPPPTPPEGEPPPDGHAPEPASMAIFLAVGLSGLCVRRRRR
ncbi:PEP-CTERM sorting domain-containing protein [Stieleria sp. TO1_6]|uniref:PEP-CTERM sorting domain-containing protein n=1 Tax=Stieleria tagensis TaxID=2956795 RepID=UPI00209B1DEA|nr:PEP-CTERM sorting domain-containing protein [Stieleria tagensis]MCO8125051.1 PEP-CTERM sorting domain-containing protein [Stieleria tagensis]